MIPRDTLYTGSANGYDYNRGRSFPASTTVTGPPQGYAGLDRGVPATIAPNINRPPPQPVPGASSNFDYTGDVTGVQWKKAKPDKIDYWRLSDAMRASRLALRTFRAERYYAIQQYVGWHWSDNGSPVKVPVNLLARYIQVVSRALVPKCPRLMLTTRQKDNAPAVSAMQEWVNQRLEQMGFAETLHRWVVDALFGIGIMKVALGTPDQSAVRGYEAPVGVPFAKTVDLDDFVFDIGCRDFRDADFIGHRYRLPLVVAENLDYFDKKERHRLSGYAAADDGRINQEGDDRIITIGQGWQSGAERDYEPLIDLWEVYIPRLKRVVTLASDHGGVPRADANPLRDQEWLGPACGPYHFLSLMVVPGQAMPKAPVQDLIDLHEFANSLYRKLVNQAQRQKEILPARGAQVDDAGQIMQASDGEIVGVDNADTMKPVSYGGPNQVNAAFAVHLTDLFGKQAGNLELLAGTAPQSKTATQDKLLAANASAGVADMQEATTVGVKSVGSAICWYWWLHPTEIMETSKSIPGLPDIGITRKLFPGNSTDSSGKPRSLRRSGRFEDLMCRVDPYSLVTRTPQDRLNFLMMLVDKLAPLMPLMQQQGIMFDMMAYLKKIAEYADEPDVTTLFTISDPIGPPQGPGDGGQTIPIPPNRSSTHEYTRRSVGQDTEANRLADLMNNAASDASSSDHGS